MARCPRCLNPLDDERNCVDARCGYRVKGSSMRPLWMIFAIAGVAHFGLAWRIGVPAVPPPVPAMYWFFVGVCWLFVNSAATIAIYAAYVFAFEREPDVLRAQAKWAFSLLRAAARGTELPAGPTRVKSPSSRG
jgi:hypothetical protein